MTKKYLGITPEGEKGFVNLEIRNDRFTASGELWNPQGTDISIGGQCLDDLLSIFPDSEILKRTYEVWKLWHLGKHSTPEQDKFIQRGVKPLYEKAQHQHKEDKKYYDLTLKRLVNRFKEKRRNVHHDPYTMAYQAMRLLLKHKPTKTSLYSFTALPNGAVGNTYNGNYDSFIIGADIEKLKRANKEPLTFRFMAKELLKAAGLYRDRSYIVPHPTPHAFVYGEDTYPLTQEVIDEVKAIQALPEPEEPESRIQILTDKFQFDFHAISSDHNSTKYKVTINNTQEFEFTQGSALPQPPEPESVLHCLFTDAYYHLYPDELDDLGYSCSEARKILEACTETYRKLLQLGITGEEIEEFGR